MGKLTPICYTWKEPEHTFQEQFHVFEVTALTRLVFLEFSQEHSEISSQDSILGPCYDSHIKVCRFVHCTVVMLGSRGIEVERAALILSSSDLIQLGSFANQSKLTCCNPVTEVERKRQEDSSEFKASLEWVAVQPGLSCETLFQREKKGARREGKKGGRKRGQVSLKPSCLAQDSQAGLY